MPSAVVHRCRSCGTTAQRWMGRCAGCGEWNSLEVRALPRAGAGGLGAGRADGGAAEGPRRLADVDPDGAQPVTTGLVELDRVLGGGLVPGSATLLFGEPGTGKSTLLLQVLAAAAAGDAALLVSAEESAAQVRARAARLGPLPDRLLVHATTDLDEAEEAVTATGARLVVVDSVHTLADRELPAPPGSLAQVRSSADRLARLARRTSAAVVLVGHVTKEGGPAGPRALEHLVDTVVCLEGDRYHRLRLLRALKHRFGPTGEVGMLEMSSGGLQAVPDPGALVLGDRLGDVPGSAVAPLLEGSRPVLVELQVLACSGGGGAGRRSVQGLDPRRVAAVAAVLECRAGVGVGGLELFVSAVGGLRVGEPAADLPLALALASAVAGHPLPGGLVAFGEVGLAGELRQVPGADRRLAEAARLGFVRAVVPARTPPGPRGMDVVAVGSLAEAVAAAYRLGRRPDPSPPPRPALVDVAGRAGGQAPAGSGSSTWVMRAAR
ncbi:MAG: DNA repair protein RadA [Acidimicrobiales bacterium]